MTQDGALILAFKIVLLAGAVSVAVFIVAYHMMTRGAVWRDPVGKTIIVKDILLGACLTPSILSLFFHFGRFTSRVAGWIDVALFGLLPVVMTWRLIVWQKIHNGGGREKEEQP